MRHRLPAPVHLGDPFQVNLNAFIQLHARDAAFLPSHS
jgi:hypothetical protein